MVSFIRSYQDAKISIERLNEIHLKEDEKNAGKQTVSNLKNDQKIFIKNVTYRYAGSSDNVLNNVNLEIPAKKITAIVGQAVVEKRLYLSFY